MYLYIVIPNNNHCIIYSLNVSKKNLAGSRHWDWCIGSKPDQNQTISVRQKLEKQQESTIPQPLSDLYWILCFTGCHPSTKIVTMIHVVHVWLWEGWPGIFSSIEPKHKPMINSVSALCRGLASPSELYDSCTSQFHRDQLIPKLHLHNIRSIYVHIHQSDVQAILHHVFTPQFLCSRIIIKPG